MEGGIMKLPTIGTLCLAGWLGAGSALADDLGWRPVIASTSPQKPLSQNQPARPTAVTLGRPIPVSLGRPQPFLHQSNESPTSIQDALIDHASAPTVLLDAPSIIRAQVPDPPPLPPPTTGDPILGPDPYA